MLNVINQKSSLNAFVGFFSQTVSSARLLYFLWGDQRWGYRHQIVVSPPSSWRRRTLLTKKKGNPHLWNVFLSSPNRQIWGCAALEAVLTFSRVANQGQAPFWHLQCFSSPIFRWLFALPPPSGWLRRPPWGPDTAAPIFQAVISPSFPVLKTP